MFVPCANERICATYRYIIRLFIISSKITNTVYDMYTFVSLYCSNSNTILINVNIIRSKIVTSFYRIVYTTRFRKVVRMVPRTQKTYSCCPGWDSYNRRHNGCIKRKPSLPFYLQFWHLADHFHLVSLIVHHKLSMLSAIASTSTQLTTTISIKIYSIWNFGYI